MKTHKRLPKALLPHPRSKGSIVRRQVHDEIKRQFDYQEIVLLTGMPAIGKTTCAIQYADSHLGKQYDHLIWLDLQQHSYELATTLASRLAKHTGRHISPKVDHQNCEQILTSLLLECSGTTDGELLLVLDHYTQSAFTDDVLHTTVDLFHLYNLKGEACCIRQEFDLALSNYMKGLRLIDEWTGHKEPDMHVCYEKIAFS